MIICMLLRADGGLIFSLSWKGHWLIERIYTDISFSILRSVSLLLPVNSFTISLDLETSENMVLIFETNLFPHST